MWVAVVWFGTSREGGHDRLPRDSVWKCAGMPGVSDPGAALVEAAVAEGHPVVPVPGPSAVLAALVVSGLPTREFTFVGFLPAKSSARQKRLQAFAREPTLCRKLSLHFLTGCPAVLKPFQVLKEFHGIHLQCKS